MPRERTENRREFLMLADVFDMKKHNPMGWFASEKIDGMRAFWDAGITRGLYADNIPFANTAKDGRLVSKSIATGLWSRSGKPIQAPAWFLDDLPAYPLDGELTKGVGTFQALVSTVKKLNPIDAEWKDVHYNVFDLPDYSNVFADGNINTANFEKSIKGVLDWLIKQRRVSWTEPKRRRFETVVYLLNKYHPSNETRAIVRAVPQEQLPFGKDSCLNRIQTLITEITSKGGEGIILRDCNSIWTPQRTASLLKVKPSNDAEVIVKGYIWGRETDRGSKLLGLMGAMIVDFNGKRLELSGFTDEERKLTCYPPVGVEHFDNRSVLSEGQMNAGKPVSQYWTSAKFPIGSKVTIKYRELTDDGLPKEARFFRKYEGI